MNENNHQSARDHAQQELMAAMAGVAGKVGGLTLVIILVSLALGMWLDKTFGTQPLFIILLVVASVPLTWYMIFRVINNARQRILDLSSSSMANANKPFDREEVDRDRD